MHDIRFAVHSPTPVRNGLAFAARTGLQPARWLECASAVAAGGIATLGHAPFHISPLYVLAVVALIRLLDAAALRQKRIAAAFGLGWWFGFSHFASGLHWLAAPFLYDFGAWGPLLGATAVLLLAAILACFWGLGSALAMTMWTGDMRRLPVFAASIALSEWLRGNAFTGFPWLLPSYVWPPGEPISQLASLVGAYGLSALTLLLAAAPATLFDAQTNLSRRLAPVLAAAIMFALSWDWGARRLAEQLPVDSDRPVVRVADSGLTQAEKWRVRPDQEWRILRRYLQASGSEGASDIVIWPEGAIPPVNFFALEDRRFLEAIGEGLGERTLIVGLTRRETEQEQILHYNSAAIIDNFGAAAELTEVYDKYRLVPFGEYIPFWKLVSNINIAPLQRIGVGFEPGAHPPRTLIVPGAPAATILICYEVIFPGLAPRGENRPAWIISVTNDAWFGDGAGPRQHFAMARYRAIETGLPMARAASGGVSAVVDASGRIVASNRDGGAEARLPAARPETLYASYGEWPLALMAFLLLLLRLVPIRAAVRAGDRARAPTTR